MISTIEAVRQLVHSAPPSLLGILFLINYILQLDSNSDRWIEDKHTDDLTITSTVPNSSPLFPQRVILSANLIYSYLWI